MAAMPAPPSAAARPHSADATPLSTAAGGRAACTHACTQAALISSTPHNNHPVTMALVVDDGVRVGVGTAVAGMRGDSIRSAKREAADALSVQECTDHWRAAP
jgi:hypothetical protein